MEVPRSRRCRTWAPDVKATEDVLDPLFENFYRRLGLPNLMRKTDYHQLVPFVPEDEIDPEIGEKLDLVVEAAAKATPLR